MERTRSIWLAMLVFGASVVGAESPPLATLADLLREAAAKNPEAEAARHRWEAAQQAVTTAKAWDDPMLTLAGRVPSSQATPASMDGDIGYGLTQRIPFFGKKALAGTIAEREAARAYEDYMAKLLEIAAALKRAYYELYYAGKSIELNRETLRLLEEITQIALTRYGVGKAAQGDVLLAQIETRKLTAELAILERKREDSAATINRLLGRRPTAPLPVPAPFEPRRAPLDEPKLWGLALEAWPGIRAAQHDVARADTAIQLAERNKRYPDIELGGMVTHYTGDRDFRMAELQVAVPLPWWNKKKYDAEVRRERANRSAAEQDLVNLRNTTMEEIHHFVTQAETARRLVELYRGGVLTQARLNVDASRASYQTGQTDFLTLLSAQRTLLSTQLDFHRALADHEKALAEIERMIGQPLGPVATPPQPKLIQP